ncbi:hypothetical protein GSQ54_22115, partial [Clostridioides difficile]|nr:hypothetical protein [Clostridioides difficile]
GTTKKAEAFTIDAKDVVEAVSTVNATNGTLTIVLDKTPTVDPVLSSTIVNVPFVAFTVDTAATTSFASIVNASAFLVVPLYSTP